MRFIIFLLDTFIITVIANGIADWQYTSNRSRGYYLMVCMCGLWLAFVYTLQFLHQHYPNYVKHVMAIPILVALLFGPRYIRWKWRHKSK